MIINPKLGEGIRALFVKGIYELSIELSKEGQKSFNRGRVISNWLNRIFDECIENAMEFETITSQNFNNIKLLIEYNFNQFANQGQPSRYSWYYGLFQYDFFLIHHATKRVLCEKMKEFDQQVEGPYAIEDLNDPNPYNLIFTHNKDFSEIDFKGNRYSQDLRQSKLIKILAEQQFLGEPYTNQKFILEKMNLDDKTRIKDIMKKSDVWKDRIIISHKIPKGSYSLVK